MSFFKNLIQNTNGKVTKLEILPQSGAAELVYSPHLLAGGIVLAAGAAWDEIAFSDRSGQLDDNSESLAGGVLTAFRVSANLPRLTRATAAMLHNNQGNPFYLRITLIDGTVLLLSDMKLQSRIAHGQLLRDFSGFRLVMESRTAIPPLFYQQIPALMSNGPAGGKVFYVDTTHHIAFEAWTVQSEEKPWETMATLPTVLDTLQDIGAGRQNTGLGLAAFTADTIFNELATFSAGGKTDWHIPSIFELKAVIDNLDYSGKVSPFTELSYLSSSQKNTTEAYIIDMTTGLVDGIDKTTALNTIFVRMYPLFSW